MKLVFALVLSLSLWSLPVVAFAASLSLTDCDADGCQGSTLHMEVTQNGNKFEVIYTIDTQGYTGDEIGFNQVGFLSVKDWGSAILLESPTVGWADPVEAPVNANSLCSNTKGNSSKICTSGFVDVKTAPGQYTWKFEVDGGYILPTTDWHLGAQYADGAGTAAGHIISTASAPIPEPSSVVLGTIGALIVGLATCRRSKLPRFSD